MKMQNIGTPLVLSYYFTKDDIEKIVEYLKDGFYQETDGKLYFTIDFNSTMDELLRLYESKIEKVTNGNGYKYEYELDIKEYKDDKIFIFQSEDGKFYKCELLASNIDNQTMIIIFNIIK